MGIPKWIYRSSLALVLALGVVFAVRKADGESKQETVADQPLELSAKDWRSALIETKSALKDKNVSMIAAGISYFSSLAFFPAIAAAVAIAAFVITPAQIEGVVAGIQSYMPSDMASLVTTQLENQVDSNRGTLLVATLAILLSLFSMSGAVDKLIKGLSIAYDATETRSFIRLRTLSVGLALGGIFMAFVVIGLLALNTDALAQVGVYGGVAWTVLALRWVVIVMLLSIILAFLYRYGPNRRNATWQWVSWGAVAATILWLIATVGFFFYVQNFGNFSESYSIFAGIIILMTWLYITALVVLVGAQVNHRLEIKTTQSAVFE